MACSALGNPFLKACEVWHDLLGSPATADFMRRSLDAGVVMDTWLSSHCQGSLTPEARRFLLDTVEGLVLHEPTPFPFLFTSGFQKVALHRILLSTVLRNSENKGEISLAEAQTTASEVRAFAAANGGPLQLVLLYAILVSQENYQALAQHRHLTRRDFILGTRHRPWSDSFGGEELEFGLKVGELEIFAAVNDQHIYLNRRGLDSLQRMEALLAASGWKNWQVEQQNISYIEHVDAQLTDTQAPVDYDVSYHRIATAVAAETTRFLDFSGVGPGMQVLEVGCGTGRMTLDLGLADRVLPEGRVVASDPSLWMLRKFHDKLRKWGGRLPQLTLSLARAENLPFGDAAFDTAVGFTFLPYAADPARAVREMTRVTRPGGAVATAVFLKWDARALAAFHPWLQPLLEIIRTHHPSFEFAGLDAGETADLFRAAGLVDVVTAPFSIPWVVDASRLTRFTMEMTAFSKVHDLLPSVEWRFLLKKLEEDAKTFFSTTSREERTFTVDYERVRGMVP